MLLSITLLAVAAILFLVYFIVSVLAGVRGQRISFRLRVIGAVSVTTSFLLGSLGWWFQSSTSAGILQVLIPAAIVMGILCSWGLLAVRRVLQ